MLDLMKIEFKCYACSEKETRRSNQGLSRNVYKVVSRHESKRAKFLITHNTLRKGLARRVSPYLIKVMEEHHLCAVHSDLIDCQRTSEPARLISSAVPDAPFFSKQFMHKNNLFYALQVLVEADVDSEARA